MEEKVEIFKYGNVRISNEVIAIIAGIAASEIEGVNSYASGFFDGISSIFSKKNYSKGIKIDLKENNDLYININVAIDYGYNVQKVAEKMQERITTEVENMTGMNVAKVNINISNVQITKNNEKKTEEESKSLDE